MQQMNELLDTGMYEAYTPTKAMTVADLLEELNLTDKFFGILVDDVKATPETKIDETSKVVIIPHISGGKWLK